MDNREHFVCFLESCNHTEILIKRNNGIVSQSTWNKIVKHLLCHKKLEEKTFGGIDLYLIIEDKYIKLLSNNDWSPFPSSKQPHWRNYISKFLEDSKGDILESLGENEFKQLDTESKRVKRYHYLTDLFFEKHMLELHNDLSFDKYFLSFREKQETEKRERLEREQEIEREQLEREREKLNKIREREEIRENNEICPKFVFLKERGYLPLRFQNKSCLELTQNDRYDINRIYNEKMY